MGIMSTEVERILKNVDNDSKMDKVSVKLENCYGINNLETIFDFKKKNANLIYAPNGSMKTSFTKTFKDYSEGKDSLDRVYKDLRPTIRNILDKAGNSINKDSIFIVESYNSNYESSKISTLLVDKKLKKEYDQLLKNIIEKKKNLINEIKPLCDLKKGIDIETNISETFSKEKNKFFQSLNRIKEEIFAEKENTLSKIKYNQVFTNDTEKILSDEKFQENIKQYTQAYDKLMNDSNIFKRGIFNHYNAAEIAKLLKKHGYFEAEHSLSLKGRNQSIKNEVELEKLILAEKEEILTDPSLRKHFEEINKLLENKDAIRNFREFLLKHQEIIPELKKPDLFKEKLWKAYLISIKDTFQEFIDEYSKHQERIKEIEQIASDQATKWQETINIFHDRFSVPFKAKIENKVNVMLNDTVSPNVKFMFADNSSDDIPIEKKDLANEVLSHGERRALYLLDIIYEIEARKNDNIETLCIVDDIADSFDYKNKYAIIEYLSDILHYDNFKQIILTHNYDFYRTVFKRLDLGGVAFHAIKKSNSIELTNEPHYRTPFKKWKNNLKSNKRNLLAIIPFIRNLAEYSDLKEIEDQLTSLLHIKAQTEKLTLGDLSKFIKNILNIDLNLQENERNILVKNLIYEEANKICGENIEGIELEKKVILSIAIRLHSEEFLIKKINDRERIENISSNQTAKLIREYKSKFQTSLEEKESIKILDKVSLMTPENIHLNSFMYEPILDMSLEHLILLLSKIKERFKLN